MQQSRDHWTQARYFAHLAVPGGEALTGPQEELACVVLEVVLLAGLPSYSLEAAADGEETGVGLAPVPGRRHAVRVLWRQDATASLHLPDELVRAQQAAMHQALRTILSAHQFWVEDGLTGEAPVVLGLTRPSFTRGRGRAVTLLPAPQCRHPVFLSVAVAVSWASQFLWVMFVVPLEAWSVGLGDAVSA